MERRSPTTRAYLLKPFVETLLKRQVDTARFMERYHLRVEDAFDPHLRIPQIDLFRFQEEAAELLGDPTLGLRLGAEHGANPYGPLKHILGASKTLGGALTAFSAYASVICDGWNIRLEQGEMGSNLIYDYDSAHGYSAIQDTDYSVAKICEFIRYRMGGQWTPVEIYLTHFSPQRRMYETVFGCPVYFEQSTNCIVISGTDLERKIDISERNPHLALYAPRPSQRDRDTESRSLAEEVSMMIGRNIGMREVSVEAVARDLHLSTRTLQRRLADEGCTFRDIVKDQRRRVSEWLLSNESNPQTVHVAMRVGYSDASAFSRAFKTWTGKAPRSWSRANTRDKRQ
jgi:AraC-like DNA-binding protein